MKQWPFYRFRLLKSASLQYLGPKILFTEPNLFCTKCAIFLWWQPSRKEDLQQTLQMSVPVSQFDSHTSSPLASRIDLIFFSDLKTKTQQNNCPVQEQNLCIFDLGIMNTKPELSPFFLKIRLVGKKTYTTVIQVELF